MMPLEGSTPSWRVPQPATCTVDPTQRAQTELTPIEGHEHFGSGDGGVTDLNPEDHERERRRPAQCRMAPRRGRGAVGPAVAAAARTTGDGSVRCGGRPMLLEGAEAMDQIFPQA